MVARAFALSLMGLGAVQALPTGNTVEERQIWIGDGSGVFIPGDGELPVCLVDGTPLHEQPPCIMPPIVGGLNPSTKRTIKKRQLVIGDPKTIFVPGQGDVPVCFPGVPLREQPPCLFPPIVGDLEPSTKRAAKDSEFIIGDPKTIFVPGQGEVPVCFIGIPLREQPPCILPPIVGGMEPSTKREVGKRQLIIGDPSEIFIPGPGEFPVCLTDVPLNEQPPCMLPPIVGGLDPSTRKREIEKRQLIIGDGSGIFIPGQGEIPVCLVDVPLNEQPPCMLPPIVGGLKPPTLPPKEKRQLIIGDGTGIFIPGQGEIPTCLVNVPINAQPPCILPPIVGGLKPPTLPKKRGFVLPPDHALDPKKVIQTLQKDLIRLQNKRHKTEEDLETIAAIKGALLYLAGITHISAPPGTGSTFTPGKRDAGFSLDTVGTYAAVCPNLEGAQIALQVLMHKKKTTFEERVIMHKLAAFLKGCGITIVKSPDGTFTTIKPSDKKREAAVKLDLTGLQTAYFLLLRAATSISPAQPSFANWLAMQQLSDLIILYGGSTEFTSTGDAAGRHPKRQDDIITIGKGTCHAGDLMGLRAALAALLTAYGHPSKAPVNIFLIEQVIVTALQLCGQSVAGWTTFTPDAPVPGAPMVPDVTIPGGPMVPDITVPGAPMVPSDKKMRSRHARRQAPALGDATAMLTALRTLEVAYGTYGSGTIPVPVWLIMVNMVTILQSIPGVQVPGWPVLGQGSVVLQPST
jgi:hypothetical protein